MTGRVMQRVNKLALTLTQRAVLKTPPLEIESALDFSVISLLRHQDILMYLISLKTFAAQCPPKQVYVVDDGSLTSADRSVLEFHVPQIQILAVSAFRHPDYPKGGCWERLAAIAILSADSYMVQLDADAVTLSSMDEVVAAIRDRRSFTLGTLDGQQLSDVEMASRYAQAEIDKGQRHVQFAAEASLATVAADVRPGASADIRYVRGCAAFAGFAPAAIGIDSLREWSSAFARRLGVRWSEWGTEQFMSNFLLANAPGSSVLPYPKYATCTSPNDPGLAFIHFAGYCRYRDGKYRNISLDVMNRMKIVK